MKIVDAVENNHRKAAVMIGFGKINPGEFREAKAFLSGIKDGIEQERQAAKGLLEALEYCAVEPEMLRPENNRQCAVAMNALSAYKARTEKGE